MDVDWFNRTAKFSNVSSLTLFFPESQGSDTIQIYYLGFLGHWTEVIQSSREAALATHLLHYSGRTILL
jgi:hypothetical protein